MAALLFVLAFACAAAIDVAHTWYLLAVDRGRTHPAAAWSVVMYALGCVLFVLVVDRSWWYMVPEALGYYAGTWIAMDLDKMRLRAADPVAHLLHGP